MRALHLTPLLLALTGPASGQDIALQRCRVIVETAARVSCYDALADSRAKAPAAPAASVAPVADVPAAKPANGFGLPQRTAEAQEVRSSVGADFAGWGPGQTIKLANGQVWQIADGSTMVMPRGTRAVAVRRGLFGAFHLEIEGLNTAPKVRRLE
jgi:hypothetical protein